VEFFIKNLDEIFNKNFDTLKDWDLDNFYSEILTLCRIVKEGVS
jgi:hypothetical protein